MVIELADDPRILRQQLEEVLAELHEAQKALEDRDRQIAELEQRLDALLRRFFGPCSEKIAPASSPWPSSTRISSQSDYPVSPNGNMLPQPEDRWANR